MPRLLRHVMPLLLIAGLSACQPSVPEPSSDAYRETVSAFYTGLAAMQVGQDLYAQEILTDATERAPGEPALWTNLGLLALRRGDYDAAATYLDEARALAPNDSRALLFSGLMESLRERPEDAVAYLRAAVEADSTNARALYALIQELQVTGSDADVQSLLDQLQAVQPNNLAVLLERARLAARQGDTVVLQQAIERLTTRASDWPDEIRAQLEAVQEAASDPAQAASPLAFLRNLLLSLPTYRADLAAIQVPVEQIGEPVQRFVRMPTPSPSPAPPDTEISLGATPLAAPDTTAWAWAGVASLTGEGIPSVFVADGRQVRLVGGEAISFPGSPAAISPGPHGIAFLDYDYDFQLDVAMAGAGGFRLFRNDGVARTFRDVTPQTGLAADLTEAAYTGAWPADLDLEGDVDLVLGTPDGPPLVLRNNGDGTFIPVPIFQDVSALRGFAWADLDADGDPDAALLDADGILHVFANDRQSRFRVRALPPEIDTVRAVAASDLDADGTIDLAILRGDGMLLRVSDHDGSDWTIHDLPRWTDAPAADARLFVADLDNNGGFDLIATAPGTTRIWLHDGQGGYQPYADAPDVHTFALGPLQDPGRLDLIGLTADGRPMQFVNQGTKQYHWKQVRPRAATAIGDQRINSFGIGGEVELRAGLLFQKQPITQTVLHFGLGEHLSADVARIVWPNGTVQAEFDLLSDEVVKAQQRLKGSCPWVFTYDGEGMRFVTDFLWRSPLGLRINAQETAGVMMTEDWIKIDGDALVPRDGVYDVRITAELWETHFFDHVSLMVVDHPAETEVFVDERFVFPPPELALHPTAPLQPIAAAQDERGQDVTDLVRALDERYLATFEKGSYQGVARAHYVEIDLGEGVPDDGPLWLVASGWVRPTDSSINVALSHGDHAPPRGLRLEVPDGEGGWTVAHDNLGFPAGKAKTVLIDLRGVFRPGTPRRVRLHTNLEVYWDEIAWATGRPDAEMAVQRLDPQTADLRYRGYSAVSEADRSSPELPDYETLAGTAPRWRDLVGYHTRFGDVRPLLRTVDDRYVIMNAGDEMALTFPAPPPPPDGWTRDFVLAGDGWVKDGDYNTTFSTTVRPLPLHDDPTYDAPPGRLQDDPAYQRHPEDWRTYHTRYVTPERFHEALRPR